MRLHPADVLYMFSGESSRHLDDEAEVSRTDFPAMTVGGRR
jgi:hypothetical protein